ncbi:MAG: hypothetical protein RBG13Loki_3775 [Promethearchaeota archaeon CR_4]|nr:MAG: hypothetical protein RBG13Loki_3775 [Candidatus Lokiarchaeota archaeon CR_4]
MKVLVINSSPKLDYRGRLLNALGDTDLIRAKPQYTDKLDDGNILDKISGLKPLPDGCLIIVNDHDRSTPTVRIVKLLREAGILVHPATFILATGTHAPTPGETAWKISGAESKDTLLVHNAGDEAQLVSAGKTSRGTEVVVNHALKSAKQVFTINGVEPHYFAGFTGGVKSLVPGLASKKTTAQNHRWAMDPGARIMHTTDNPLHEDLWEAANLAFSTQEVTTVQLVNHGSDILFVSAGFLRPAFESAKDAATRVYGLGLQERVDRIVSIVESPLDHTLYQAQKAMENAKHVLRDGGTFILVATCDQGIGTAAFFKRLQALGTPENVLKSLSFEDYQFGDHKAFYWAELAKRVELLYTGDLPQDVINSTFMRKVTVGDLVTLVNLWKSQGDRILLDEAGGYSAVYLQGN